MELLKIDPLVNIKVIQESCSRIGVADKKHKILYPSCYCIKQDDGYYIAHFKQLFMLKNGGYNNISEDDLKRRNAIAFCLRSWGLIDVIEESITPHDCFVFVLPHKEKDSWKINHKINSYSFE